MSQVVSNVLGAAGHFVGRTGARQWGSKQDRGRRSLSNATQSIYSASSGLTYKLPLLEISDSTRLVHPPIVTVGTRFGMKQRVRAS